MCQWLHEIPYPLYHIIWYILAIPIHQWPPALQLPAIFCHFIYVCNGDVQIYNIWSYRKVKESPCWWAFGSWLFWHENLSQKYKYVWVCVYGGYKNTFAPTLYPTIYLIKFPLKYHETTHFYHTFPSILLLYPMLVDSVWSYGIFKQCFKLLPFPQHYPILRPLLDIPYVFEPLLTFNDHISKDSQLHLFQLYFRNNMQIGRESLQKPASKNFHWNIIFLY